MMKDENSSVLVVRGKTPADAELDFMENVKKLELYGVELQAAKV
jgi:hypothetical protein